MAAMNDPEVFRAQLDTVFLAQHAADRVGLRLIDIADERVARGIQQFSLFFHGPGDLVLPQGTYEFHGLHGLNPRNLRLNLA
jgi:hypothetical protein